MSDPCLVLCTCPNQASAKAIAQALVEQQLAACVNMIANVQSIYVWQGEVCEDAEVQLLIKTQQQHLDKAFETVQQMHEYDVPEWLVISEVSGSEAYLSWMKSSLI